MADRRRIALHEGTWFRILFQACMTASLTAGMAPLFGNDPAQMGVRGFFVGLAFAPFIVRLQSS